jgi:hypothetical protein
MEFKGYDLYTYTKQYGIPIKQHRGTKYKELQRKKHH